MNQIFILIFLFSGFQCTAQERVTFTYDTAGNQTRREIICITCTDPGGRYTANTAIPDNFKQSNEYEEISYYPNPVLEQLYIKWLSNELSYPTSLEVYSMSGQIVKSKSIIRESTDVTIEFQNLAQGFYSVVLLYNNGESKILKVVKH